ncbi:phosphatase PAP2 family protein [bacterium]|nr:phosphatase PAP2 family protein [bacterium]
MNNYKKLYFIPLVLLLVFVVFIVLVKTVDVSVIGENSTNIGLTFINKGFYESHKLINNTFYNVSKYLGYLSFLIIGFFLVVGVIQLIKRKGFFKVDTDLLLLGAIYVLTMVFYVFFEIVVVNVRPIIVDEPMEASFPSSHTLLAVVAVGTLLFEILKRISNKYLKWGSLIAASLFMIVLIVFRLLSGVHWVTDIIAGIILGLAIVSLFIVLNIDIKEKQINQEK